MGTPVQRSRPLVLVAGNDPFTHRPMCSALERDGFLVERAANGNEALALFESLRPDVVVLDEIMAEMDGFAACDELRKKPNGALTPVLIVTGLKDVISIHRAYEVGATDFITKPINCVLLSYRLRYVLRANQTIRELLKTEDRLSSAQRIARLGHWDWDMRLNHMRCSEETYRLLGLDPQEPGITFEAFQDCIHPEEREAFQRMLEQALKHIEPFAMEHRIVLAEGTERYVHQQAEVFFDQDSHSLRLLGTIQDTTELRRTEEQIRYLAYYDSLTSLPNRSFFHENFSQALSVAKRHGRMLGTLFLDLDDFKRINDTLGHSVGDLLLKEVADRLTKCLRETDVIARQSLSDLTNLVSRLGGDEFTILLTEIRHPEDCGLVAQRILKMLSEPFMLIDQEVFITTAIGISVYPMDGDEVDVLLKNADTAMYHAKNQGRGNYQYYTKSMNARALERLNMENDLRRALERQEFLLNYQPILDMQTRKVRGLEALIRWQNPQRGLVSPADFIPLAEETGLIVSIGEWVLRTACAQNKAWQEAGLPAVTMSVNLSSRQFRDPEMIQKTVRVLNETGLAPGDLVLELTESTTIQDAEATQLILQELRSKGISLAIDDFGTGYSSLSYLRRFPFDHLKIDRAFVKDITTDPVQTAILEAMITMAHSLQLTVVAEGVETEEQAGLLKKLNCDQVQGFLFSRPLPPEGVEQFFQEQEQICSKPR